MQKKIAIAALWVVAACSSNEQTNSDTAPSCDQPQEMPTQNMSQPTCECPQRASRPKIPPCPG